MIFLTKFSTKNRFWTLWGCIEFSSAIFHKAGLETCIRESGKRGAEKWFQELTLEYVGQKQSSGVKAAKRKKLCSNSKLAFGSCGAEPVLLRMQFRKKGKMRPMSQLWKEWGGKVFSRAGLGKCALEKWCQRVFAIRLDSGKSGAEACF